MDDDLTVIPISTPVCFSDGTEGKIIAILCLPEAVQYKIRTISEGAASVVWAYPFEFEVIGEDTIKRPKLGFVMEQDTPPF